MFPSCNLIIGTAATRDIVMSRAFRDASLPVQMLDPVEESHPIVALRRYFGDGMHISIRVAPFKLKGARHPTLVMIQQFRVVDAECS